MTACCAHAGWLRRQPYFEELLAAATPSIEQQLIDSLSEDVDEDFALAAAADLVDDELTKGLAPTIERLPLSFDPTARFLEAKARRLSYPAASALRQTIMFDRPEGSFAVRAFGNVVHRYLQLLAARLERDATCDELLAELPAWKSRLEASLRGEGLPPGTRCA